jgi:hypothetical protein
LQNPGSCSSTPKSFEIRDAVGQGLVYIYFDDDAGRRAITKRISKDEARRLAQQIVRLPELVRIARGIDAEHA